MNHVIYLDQPFASTVSHDPVAAPHWLIPSCRSARPTGWQGGTVTQAITETATKNTHLNHLPNRLYKEAHYFGVQVNATRHSSYPHPKIRPSKMFKFLLALVAVAAANPNYNQPTTGQWVPAEQFVREPHQLDTAPAEAPGLLESIGARLGNWWTWDRDTVRRGVFENENIMIHVGQNMFNFVFTTLAWFTVSQIYSASGALNTPRAQKALTLTEAADEVLDAIRQFEEKKR